MSRTWAAAAGLLIAWGGTALLASTARVPSSLLAKVLGQAALWLLCVAIIGIVLFWERKPLASLWLRHFQWQSFAWAGVLTVGATFVLFPATEWVRKALALPGYAAGMDAALANPLWLRILAILTAGIVEETLFRGYAVTRLLQLTGNLFLAVALSSGFFAALHLPMWGPGPSLSIFIGSLAMTAFFVWRRDLLAMIVAHVAIDAWGLVVAPGSSTWWK